MKVVAAMSCYEFKGRRTERNSLIYKAVWSLYNLANNLEKKIYLASDEHTDQDEPHLDIPHFDVTDNPHMDEPHADFPN